MGDEGVVNRPFFEWSAGVYFDPHVISGGLDFQHPTV